MNKRYTLFFFLGVFLISMTHAQFNKGYIVTLDDDTVSGFLRNLPEMGYERSVEFKPKRKGTSSIIFTADEIDGFFIYPRLYFKATFSPIPNDSLSHIFMERLYHGRLRFYVLELSAIPLYFVQKNDGPLIQLIGKNGEHRKVLEKLTLDCDKMIMASLFPLTSGSLIRFGQRYDMEMGKQESRKTRN
jgi:hypothetical protein